MTRRGAARAAATIGVVVVSALPLAACGSDRTSASSGASGSSSGSSGRWDYNDPAGSARSVHVEPSGPGLPPRSFQGLSAIYAEPVQALGMRLTRASVIQLTTGPHLQIYIEPMGPTTNADYVDRIVTLAKAVAPGAFADWSALATIDVCQEPPPGVDDSKEPPPETVLFMTRAQSAQVTWETATVKDLRRIIATTSGGELQVSRAIESDPAWTSTAP